MTYVQSECQNRKLKNTWDLFFNQQVDLVQEYLRCVLNKKNKTGAKIR